MAALRGARDQNVTRILKVRPESSTLHNRLLWSRAASGRRFKVSNNARLEVKAARVGAPISASEGCLSVSF
jgi:hypothetical protein